VAQGERSFLTEGRQFVDDVDVRTVVAHVEVKPAVAIVCPLSNSSRYQWLRGMAKLEKSDDEQKACSCAFGASGSGRWGNRIENVALARSKEGRRGGAGQV